MKNIKENCTSCAKCCLSLTENGHFIIPISKEDCKKIKKNNVFKDMKKKGRVKIKKGKYDKFYPKELIGDGDCCFLTDVTKKCLIYEDRPNVCKQFFCDNFSVKN